MKKNIVIIIILVIVVLGGIWLYRQKFYSNDNSYSKKITIGVVDFPGYAGLYLAQNQAFFEKAGLNVELKKYSSLTEQNQDFIDGKIDVTVNTSVEEVSQALLSSDRRIVAIIDSSKGADGILVDKSIKSIADLRNKKVAYELGTLEEYILAKALEPTGISLKEIEGVNASPEDAVKLLNDNQVDAAVSYEPFLTQGLSNNSTDRLIWSTKEHPDLIYDLLVFHSSFVDKFPITTSKLVQAYFEAIEYSKKNPEILANTLAKEFSISVEDAKTQLSAIKILDLKENKEKFASGFNENSIYSSLRRASNFYQTNINNSYRINTDSLVDPTFVLNSP